MPAITDLTWSQLNQALIELNGGTGIIETNDSDFATVINVGKTLGYPPTLNDNSQGTYGVIRFMARLLDACRLAQETVNQGQSVGERLAAFPAPTPGATTGGYAALTRSMTGRHDLTSSNKVIGGNV